MLTDKVLMKRALTLFFALSLTLATKAADWKLVWNDPNPAGSVNTYKIVEITAAGMQQVAVVNTTSWKIVLPAGLHTIGVIAVGTNAVDSDVTTIPVGILTAVVNLKVSLE